jgi:pantoate--beta-alanine ligase
MIIFDRIDALKEAIRNQRNLGKNIGFVPTMGALHMGHISLLEQAKKKSDVTVVSIFVNPTQFNKAEDLDKYPRVPEKDIEMLQLNACDFLFMPSVSEVYPVKDERSFSFGSLETVMEGAFRPGHFNGVAQVVSRLFYIVEPDIAFFGQKDYQQLLIVKELIRQLDFDIEIIECPVYRESDGLAMSSRNTRLSETERKEAPFIYSCLKEAVDKLKFATAENIKTQVEFKFRHNPAFKLEYFEIAEQKSLEPVSGKIKVPAVACIAAWLGNVRLIDNIKFNPKH